jgi:hypothetical protein
MTDNQILNEIQYHLVESVDGGVAWSSELWEADEVIGYLNDRQRRFLIDTGLILSQETLNTTPNVETHPLPADWMATRRVSWHTPTTRVPLMRGDSLQADTYDGTTYNTAIRPKLYFDTETPTLQIRISPASFDNGVLELWYVALPAALSNTGISLVLPDECAATIKWGVLADMLSKVGRGYDPERAKYCESLYEAGVEATTMMLDGYGS